MASLCIKQAAFLALLVEQGRDEIDRVRGRAIFAADDDTPDAAEIPELFLELLHIFFKKNFFFSEIKRITSRSSARSSKEMPSSGM